MIRRTIRHARVIGSTALHDGCNRRDQATPEMVICDAETFDPITVIVRARDTVDAIWIVSDAAYGPLPSVLSRDVTREIDVAMPLRRASCRLDRAIVQTKVQAPFGGIKGSGYGRFDGRLVNRRDHRTEVAHDRAVEPALSDMGTSALPQYPLFSDDPV